MHAEYLEISWQVIPGTMNNQERKYLSLDKENRFLWPEKDNPARRLVDKQHDSQSTGSKEDKQLFNKYSDSISVATIGHKSSTRKNSVVLADFSQLDKNTTRGKIHSKMHLRKQLENKRNTCLEPIILENCSAKHPIRQFPYFSS
jgi:hypothetical protein